ncbi:NfeD family protein [Desulfoferrobacter suflitae]|uniref:NfeD family protein n=1 Tax=Desulfoferrobacter suflitae TaxID=2865782 RepID=UPI002164DB8B|nr:nodulation protein NfeD [Desulfoferrobacter suflitae]MCK8603079.1 nodulation protein NfeD [Desulfoferrobacter suflitae]
MRCTGHFRQLLLWILTPLILSVFLPGSACRAATHLNMIHVQDSINPGVQDFIESAIEQSESDGAQCLIIFLDTPGGLVTSMRGIVQSILNSKIPVIVYVYPSGAQAASAGVFVTVAADIAAMAPGTNIGAAHPVASSGEDVPKTMNEKVVNDMLAFARSIGQQRGRNEQWLEDAVKESVSITAEEAFKNNVIDLVADDIPDLLKKLDGWELQRKGYSVTLHTLDAEQRTLEPGWLHQILRAISNPNIAYILLMIGLAGLYFELSQPGAILPGVVGGIALILALYALQSLPVNYAGILLILLAIIFFILEIKIASYGMLSFAGVTCLILGSLMLFRTRGYGGQLDMSVFIPTVVAVSAFFVAIASLAFRAQMRKPQTGIDALQGETGIVRQDLSPVGKVFIAGELWNAEADEDIAAGQRVQVVSVENLKLKVKRIDAN